MIDLNLGNPVPPTQPPDATDVFLVQEYIEDIKEYKQKVQAFLDFKSSLYSLVFGQCLPAMQEQIWLHNNFDRAQNNRIRLLILIKALMHLYKPGTEKLGQVIANTMSKFYSMKHD